ncbi:MAG: hypothetical protein EAX86_10525 [Candidatus Heimdallarchaeota archaeon]|nr:hypothetical protein [Candidatus Heimdallarchaeota archaeon]
MKESDIESIINWLKSLGLTIIIFIIMGLILGILAGGIAPSPMTVMSILLIILMVLNGYNYFCIRELRKKVDRKK